MSATAIPICTLTLKATAAVTARRFVTALGAPAAAAGRALGVARTSAAIGDYFPCDTLGTASVEAGGAIAAGARIEIDAQGRAVTLASGVAVGVALEAASGAGACIECHLITN